MMSAHEVRQASAKSMKVSNYLDNMIQPEIDDAISHGLRSIGHNVPPEAQHVIPAILKALVALGFHVMQDKGADPFLIAISWPNDEDDDEDAGDESEREAARLERANRKWCRTHDKKPVKTSAEREGVKCLFCNHVKNPPPVYTKRTYELNDNEVRHPLRSGEDSARDEAKRISLHKKMAKMGYHPGILDDKTASAKPLEKSDPDEDETMYKEIYK
jgi:hypothetical protein